MMAYREKTAWLAIAGMVIGYGLFFGAAQLQGGLEGMTVGRFLLWLAIASAVRVTIELVGRFVLARQMGAEAGLPADERDRAIAARSATFAYAVLLTGMIVVGMIMPFSAQGIAIVVAALVAIIAAELVRYFAIALSYRLGWQ